MSQLENIKDALEAGDKLTPIDALERFGCFRLGARVHDLKAKGMHIETEIIEDRTTGKRFARYSSPQS